MDQIEAKENQAPGEETSPISWKINGELIDNMQNGLMILITISSVCSSYVADDVITTYTGDADVFSPGTLTNKVYISRLQ